MELTTDDRLALYELVSLHGHLMDDGDFERLDELFTADVAYDLSAYGRGTLRGIGAIVNAARTLGNANPVGHHVTNVVITEIRDASVSVVSKGIGIRSDGSCGSVVYHDEIRKEAAGWRIAQRRLVPRREPLRAPETDSPRALVEKFLQLVDRGEWQGLAELYSPDAAVEQPFAKPQPVVLRGREAIRAHFVAASGAPFRLRVIDPVIRTTSDPEVVVAEYQYDGEATNTGRRFVVANVQVFRIRAGEIVSTRDFHDHAAFSAALQR